MDWKEFYRKAINNVALSDGSMGVLLQKYGLTGEDCPELWNVINSNIIIDIHKSYIDAGSDMVLTNTLGGNRVKLADYKLENRLKELNEAGVRNAKKAEGNNAIVAGDVGPTGLFIEPLGNTTFDEMVDIYKEQIKVLAEAGCDCIIFETHIDILEIKAAIIACHEVCDLPIIASVTFEKDGRTVTGSSPEAVFTTLEALGVDIMGTNCGTGPSDMLKTIEIIGTMFKTPIIAQANAGMPQIVNGKTVFTESPEIFIIPAIEMVKKGVHVMGGCCGTTPEHIKIMHTQFQELKPYLERKINKPAGLNLSSRYIIHSIGFDRPFTIIGERLNPTARKVLSQDITEGKFILFKDEAINQQKAGAHILDMNMGIPNTQEPVLIKKGIDYGEDIMISELATLGIRYLYTNLSKDDKDELERYLKIGHH